MISLCFLIIILSYSAVFGNSNDAVQVHVVKLPNVGSATIIVNNYGSNNTIIIMNPNKTPLWALNNTGQNSGDSCNGGSNNGGSSNGGSNNGGSNNGGSNNGGSNNGGSNNGDTNNGGSNANGANNSDLISPEVFTNCAQAIKKVGKSGVYNIVAPDFPDFPTFKAFCMLDPSRGKGWTIIQRRQYGSVDFNQNWTTYETGFGHLNAEHFLGLKATYALTNGYFNHELWIKLDDWEGQTRWAKYRGFSIGDANESYNLRVENYTGNAGNSFDDFNGIKFSTYDQDHDENPTTNCAANLKAGWWLKHCPQSNLNGQYFEKNNHGIIWDKWHGLDYSLKYTQMAIRSTGYMRNCEVIKKIVTK